jgi:hypothetical protein
MNFRYINIKLSAFIDFIFAVVYHYDFQYFRAIVGRFTCSVIKHPYDVGVGRFRRFSLYFRVKPNSHLAYANMMSDRILIPNHYCLIY